ncbi:MAG: hypothetical protein OIF57_01840 [Marinobacterium sp.]|nr:hypothetical protein [Marinobacterium sp.]
MKLFSVNTYLLKAASLCGLLMFSTASYAELSCDELFEMRQAVGQLADAVDETFIFTRDDDEFLADVVELMYAVAEEEDNRTLFNAARDMERAWQREDADAYVDALDIVMIEVDDIYHFECGRKRR